MQITELGLALLGPFVPSCADCGVETNGVPIRLLPRPYGTQDRVCGVCSVRRMRIARAALHDLVSSIDGHPFDLDNDPDDELGYDPCCTDCGKYAFEVNLQPSVHSDSFDGGSLTCTGCELNRSNAVGKAMKAYLRHVRRQMRKRHPSSTQFAVAAAHG